MGLLGRPLSDLVDDLIRYESLGATWPAAVQSWMRRLASGKVRIYVTVQPIRPPWGVMPPEVIPDLEWPAEAPPPPIGQVVRVVLYREHWQRWEQVEIPHVPFPMTRVVLEGVWCLHFSGPEPEPDADQPIVIEPRGEGVSDG